MKKIQVPVLGGLRKVIQPGNTTTAGTTIAEVGAGTISLAQLAALITQIQAQQANTGGGNIGDGTEAFLSVGPGLAGGGPMLGTVKLRLTIPSALIAEDGVDGDPGLQGVQGLRGVQGPAGVALLAEDGTDGDPGAPGMPGSAGVAGAAGSPGLSVYLLPEDGTEGDPGAPGAPGIPGATGPTGAAGVSGVPQLVPEDPTDNDSFGIMPTPQAVPSRIINTAVPWVLFQEDTQTEELLPQPLPSSVGSWSVSGSLIVNGAGVSPIILNTVDNVPTISMNEPAGAVSGYYMGFSQGSVLKGAIGLGSIIFSGAAIGDMGVFAAGTLRLGGTGSGALAVLATGPLACASWASFAGATPPVTANQTALGTTTTVTVITTAGGIALPALASTFWVVNVNGVKYGIPCFAL